MEEVTKQKQSEPYEVLKLIADRYLRRAQPSTWKELSEFINYLQDDKTALIVDVGLEEEIGTSQVTNVGKNLVNSTSNDSL